MRDIANFARIEFTRHEIEALRELSAYVDQVAPAHNKLLSEDVELSRKVRAVRRAIDACGQKIAGKNLQPVDLTKDECEAIDCIGEGFLQALREAGALPTVSQNQRIGNFAVVLSRVRMKVSTAAAMIKPNIATDLRLS